MKKCLEDDNGGLLTDPLFQRLFRLFLLFSENSINFTEPSQLPNGRALNFLTPTQAHFLINEFFRLIKPRRPASTIQLPSHAEKITFRGLVEAIDLIFPDRKLLEPVVDRVFDRYVSQIVNKGFVMCRKIPTTISCIGKRSNPKKWKSYWCTLIPGTVFLWPLDKTPTVSNRQAITLDANTVVHMGSFEEDRFTWQLLTSNAKYQFGHFDEIQRQHWISDMNLVIEYRTKSDLLDFDKAYSNKHEHMGHNHDKDVSWKLALESENQRLVDELEEERKALYDEEIVRQLATRMLDEERERNEKLEKTLHDFQNQLEAEQEFRHQLEDRLNDQILANTALVEAAASGEPVKLTPEQLDYLIISTQSI